MEVIGFDTDQVLVVHRWREDERSLFVANLNKTDATVTLALPRGHWRKAVRLGRRNLARQGQRACRRVASGQ